jgi:hypothetical protein
MVLLHCSRSALRCHTPWLWLQVNVTLIATGFGPGDGKPGSALPAFGTGASQPASGATQEGQPPPLPARESGGIEIPAFLRKRRDRGK